jgi:hypothetical protein
VIIPVTVIVNLPDSASAAASPEERGTGNQASAGKKDKQAAKDERKAEKKLRRKQSKPKNRLRKKRKRISDDRVSPQGHRHRIT